MDKYLEYQITEIKRVKLLREPTEKELKLIVKMNDEYEINRCLYHIGAGLLDFDTEEVINVEYDWVKII